MEDETISLLPVPPSTLAASKESQSQSTRQTLLDRVVLRNTLVLRWSDSFDLRFKLIYFRRLKAFFTIVLAFLVVFLVFALLPRSPEVTIKSVNTSALEPPKVDPKNLTLDANVSVHAVFSRKFPDFLLARSPPFKSELFPNCYS